MYLQHIAYWVTVNRLGLSVSFIPVPLRRIWNTTILKIIECTRVTPRRVPSLGKYNWAKIKQIVKQIYIKKCRSKVEKQSSNIQPGPVDETSVRNN